MTHSSMPLVWRAWLRKSLLAAISTRCYAWGTPCDGFRAPGHQPCTSSCGTWKPMVRRCTSCAIHHQELVLCHGDLSSHHVFVDPELRVCGLIDWGMWGAAPAIDDLAEVAMRYTEPDFDAVLVGHSGTSARDPDLRRAVSLAMMTRSIGHLRWLVTSGQTGHVEIGVAPLQRALKDLLSTG